MPSELSRKAVGPIPHARLPYGLLSAATVVAVDDVHELNGVDWPEDGCGVSHTTDWCPPGEEPGAKQYSRFAWDSAPPVTVYYGIECSAVGFSVDDAARAARTGFSLGEQTALEEWLQEEVLAVEAEDVTPAGGPVPIAQSIGVLEGALAERYGGQGVLHIPAGVSAMLGATSQFAPGDGRISWLGNRFALGGGYQSNVGPTPPAAGQAWLYATGPVMVRQGPVDELPLLERGGVDETDNNRYAQVERTSVVQVACTVVATLASVSCDC